MQPTDGGAEASAAVATAPTSAAPDYRRFLLFGRIEGISLLLLFGVAMPLKYGAGIDLAVTIVGSAHGALFVAFVLWHLAWWRRARWPFGLAVLIGLSSTVPFGFVWTERKLAPRPVSEPAPDSAPGSAADPAT